MPCPPPHTHISCVVPLNSWNTSFTPLLLEGNCTDCAIYSLHTFCCRPTNAWWMHNTNLRSIIHPTLPLTGWARTHALRWNTCSRCTLGCSFPCQLQPSLHRHLRTSDRTGRRLANSKQQHMAYSPSARSGTLRKHSHWEIQTCWNEEQLYVRWRQDDPAANWPGESWLLPVFRLVFTRTKDTVSTLFRTVAF